MVMRDNFQLLDHRLYNTNSNYFIRVLGRIVESPKYHFFFFFQKFSDLKQKSVIIDFHVKTKPEKIFNFQCNTEPKQNIGPKSKTNATFMQVILIQ